MRPAKIAFGLRDLSAGVAILDALESRFSTRRVSRVSGGRFAYYDSFDWRLDQADLRMRVTRTASGYGVHLEGDSVAGSGGDRTVRVRTVVQAQPGLSSELREGPLRTALSPILEMRRAVPVLEVEGARTEVAILDDERKTRARVFLEEARVRRPGSGSDWKPLPPILQTSALRGYPKTHQKVVRFIEQEGGLETAVASLFTNAADALGLAPASFSWKVAFPLDGSAPAARSVSTIYRRLLEIMRANERGVRADTDSEFLHDFRVSVRRTRVGLGQLKGCFEAEEQDPFRTHFSWLGSITGPTRDLDVYLLKMPSYRKKLPEAIRADLDPLSDYLRRHQRLEQRKLSRALASPRYRELISAWSGFLDRIDLGDAWGPSGSLPTAEVASKRIWKVYRRVIKKGSAIRPDSPANPVHRLRIDCKKLRYLMEFFRGLYPADEIGLSIKALKSLQDTLGDFNDYEVQQVSLKQFSREMVREELAPIETLMAIGRLVERLELGQASERQEFHRRFDRFASAGNAKHFRRLFKERIQENDGE